MKFVDVVMFLWVVLAASFIGFSIAGKITTEARSNQNKINELIQQCEASLPRNQHCEITFVPHVVENKE